MKTLKTISIILSLIMTVGFVAYFISCNNKPTEPTPTEYEDYVVLIKEGLYDHHSNWLFLYHPTTNILDTAYLSVPFGGFEISPDGKKLFVNIEDTIGIGVFDLDSLDYKDSLYVAEVLPYHSALAVSPDNKYLAVYGTDGLYLLSTVDYSIVFHDETIVTNGYFSSNSNRFYGCNDLSTYVFVIDLEDQNFPTSIVNFGMLVTRIIPSPDETKWFLYLKLEGFYYFYSVYEPETDSIIFNDTLIPGLGEIAITPNGNFVFYSNPGNMIMAGAPCFWVYDAQKNEMVKRICTFEISETNPPIVDHFTVTPDGNWLVFSGYTFLITLDLGTLEIVHYTKIKNGGRIDQMGCQRLP